MFCGGKEKDVMEAGTRAREAIQGYAEINIARGKYGVIMWKRET